MTLSAQAAYAEAAPPLDLNPQHLEIIWRILRDHVPEYEVRAYGSRVAWTASETSDLDLALMTDAPLDAARTADEAAPLTVADDYLAAPLSAPVEVHPADAPDLPDPLGKARAAVPGRPAIWLEGGE